MKNTEQRAKYDDFELKDDYDFTGGVRARFYKSKKIPTTMRLDNDVIIFLKKKAAEKHIAYQSLINSLLRQYMEKDFNTDKH